MSDDEPTDELNSDNSMLLSALLSGGVIGGTVGFIDNSFDRAKWAIPAGMLLGIFLDYQLKKAKHDTHVEVAKGYFAHLWEDSDPLLPETNTYWSALVSSLAVVSTITLATYGYKAFIGKWQNAGLGPLPDVGNDVPAEELPVPQNIGEIALNNPVNAIIAPATMQILAAFAGKNQPAGRRAGTALAAQVILQVMKQSNLENALVDLAGKTVSEIRDAAKKIVGKMSSDLVDGLALRQDKMYLSNERLLLLQNEDGTQAAAVLHNQHGDIESVPAVRVPFETWTSLQGDLANRLNITPIQEESYHRQSGPMQLSDLEASNTDSIKPTFSQLMAEADDIENRIKKQKDYEEGRDGEPITPETTMSSAPPSLVENITTRMTDTAMIARLNDRVPGTTRTLRQIVLDVAYSGHYGESGGSLEDSLVRTMRDIDIENMLAPRPDADIWQQKQKIIRWEIMNTAQAEYGGQTLREMVIATLQASGDLDHDAPAVPDGGFVLSATTSSSSVGGAVPKTILKTTVEDIED